MNSKWNPELYDTHHIFVTKYAEDLLPLLNPQKGETILDLGCGTGHTVFHLSQLGAKAIGIDNSQEMISKARNNYPDLAFYLLDGHDFHFQKPFDAVFSNAALHWMLEPEKVIANVWDTLKSQGRFVAEFGGQGNIQAIVEATRIVLRNNGYKHNFDLPWFFPTIAQYTSMLENKGFRVVFAQLFDRPTPLSQGEDGLRNWFAMFGARLLQEVSLESIPQILDQIEHLLRPNFFRNGVWIADYVRLRILAIKPEKV